MPTPAVQQQQQQQLIFSAHFMVRITCWHKYKNFTEKPIWAVD